MKNGLTKDFYEKTALIQAANAYKSLASISISEDSNYYYYDKTTTYHFTAHGGHHGKRSHRSTARKEQHPQAQGVHHRR